MMKPSNVRVCGVLNILVGGTVFCLGGFCGAAYYVAASMYGGDVSYLMVAFAVMLAGVLSVISGGCLFFSSERARLAAIGLLALAVVVSLTYFVFIVWLVVPMDGLISLVRDDFNLLAFWLPALVLLLGFVELFYLKRELCRLEPLLLFQFRLRTLLIITACIAVLIGVMPGIRTWQYNNARQQQFQENRLNKAGVPAKEDPGKEKPHDKRDNNEIGK
jgi:hypothetical protein